MTWLWPYVCVPAGKLLNITCLSCASLTYSKTYRYFTRLNISQAFSLTNAYGRHHFIQIPCQNVFFWGASIYIYRLIIVFFLSLRAFRPENMAAAYKRSIQVDIQIIIRWPSRSPPPKNRLLYLTHISHHFTWKSTYVSHFPCFSTYFIRTFQWSTWFPSIFQCFSTLLLLFPWFLKNLQSCHPLIHSHVQWPMFFYLPSGK